MKTLKTYFLQSQSFELSSLMDYCFCGCFSRNTLPILFSAQANLKLKKILLKTHLTVATKLSTVRQQSKQEVV